MKTYTNNTFDGHWPVGSAAVVMAEDADAAAFALEKELAKHGLVQKIKAEDMQEFTEGVRILNDGNY